MSTSDQEDQIRSFLVNIIDNFLTFKKTEMRSFKTTEKYRKERAIYDSIIDGKIMRLTLKRPDIDFFNLRDLINQRTGMVIYNSSNIIELIESGINFVSELESNKESSVYKQFLLEVYDAITHPFDYIKFIKFLNKCKKTTELNIYKKFFNNTSTRFFGLYDPEDKTKINAKNLIKDTAVMVRRQDHASVLYISLSNQIIYNFDPSFINPEEVFKERIFPLMIRFPELQEFSIKNVVDINIQAIGETKENIDIYCKAWIVHFLTNILVYKVTPEEYSLMLNQAIVKAPTDPTDPTNSESRKSERLLNEIKGFIVRELNEAQLSELKKLLPSYKKYIKYKMKYIKLLNEIKNI